MFNNINNGNGLLYNSTAQMSNPSNVINLASIRSNLQKSGYSPNLVDQTEISANAIKLFQKDLDIKKFTKLLTEDENDNSHLERIRELFNNGVIDAFEDDVLSELVTNQKLWDDLIK